ncbi:MAG: tetratricopeptide repeat protein [Dysgonamonadaceae bacterium]|jgi:tetratricopeptide (TPR) repeat protein|nr:tetratricopeptide repeat protein [Dysgonamonadaceae bacterium]
MKRNGKRALGLIGIFLFLGTSLFASSNEKGIEYYRAELYGAAKIFFLGQKNQPAAEQAENYYYLGQTYYQLNQLDSALYFYQKAVEVDPLYPFGYIGEGKLELKNGNLKVADELFKKAGGLTKKDPTVYGAIAEVYADLDINDGVKPALEKARKANKKYAGAFMVEGDVLIKQGKVGEAILRYENALLLDAKDKLAYLKIARVYKDVNPPEALNYLDRLLAIDADYIPAYALIGDINRDLGDYQKALDAYEKFISIQGVPLLQQERYAQLLYFTNQFDKSLAQIKVVLSQEPDNNIMHRFEAYNSYKLENNDLGIEQMKFFLQNTEKERHIYSDYLYYGNMLLAKKLPKQAIESYEKAAKLDSSKPEIYKALADAASAAALYPEAIKYYEKYIEDGGDAVVATDFYYYGSACYQLGKEIALRPQDTPQTPEALALESVEFNAIVEKGDKAFSEVINRVSTSHLGYLGKANLYALVDLYDQTRSGIVKGVAKPYYDTAIEFMQSNNENGARNKDLISSYLYLLSYYSNIDNSDALVEYSKKILQLDPNDAKAKQTLDILKVKY